MADDPKLIRRPIVYLHVLSESGGTLSGGHVSCSSIGGSVPLSCCAHCKRFVKVTVDDGGYGDAVHCQPGPASDPVSDMLTIPRASVMSLMSREVVCVRRDLSLDALGSIFLETELTALPVIDEKDAILGFVDRAQIALAAHAVPRPLTVDDVLMTFAVTVPEATSVTQAAAVMAFERQQRLAVTAADGSIVGVLSAVDILLWLARSDGHIVPSMRALQGN